MNTGISEIRAVAATAPTPDDEAMFNALEAFEAVLIPFLCHATPAQTGELATRLIDRGIWAYLFAGAEPNALAEAINDRISDHVRQIAGVHTSAPKN